MKIHKEALADAEDEDAMIADLSLSFEDAGIVVPVISAYETKATKIGDAVFSSRRAVVLDDSSRIQGIWS